MAKHYNTQNDSASLSAFFFYVHNVISLLILYCFDSPVPSCEEAGHQSPRQVVRDGTALL